MSKLEAASIYQTDYILYQKLFKPKQDVSWQDVVKKDPCSYCGNMSRRGRGSNPTMEHVVPKSAGGSGRWDNIVGACSACNVRRDRLPILMALVKPPPKLLERWKEKGSIFLLERDI